MKPTLIALLALWLCLAGCLSSKKKTQGQGRGVNGGNPNSVKNDSRGKRLGQSRGRAGIKANVARVDTNKGMIYVDGLTISTSDGKEEGVPIRPSNLVVTNLYEGDPLRIKRLMERFRRGETDE